MRILCIGDIVGGSGLKRVQQELPTLKRDRGIDFVVANGENCAGGLGLTGLLAKQLYASGVDCITLGNHSWSKWELTHWIDSDPAMVRPLNGGKNWPGRGMAVFKRPEGNILVTQLLGAVFMDSCQSPFDAIEEQLASWKKEYSPVCTLVDFHAEATAEKVAMAHFLDGRVSAVFGTHTHVQTADARILERGTGYITDLGMTGPHAGVIGMDADSALRRFVNHLPSRYQLAAGPTSLQGALLEVDTKNGRCTHIETIFVGDPL